MAASLLVDNTLYRTPSWLIVIFGGGRAHHHVGLIDGRVGETSPRKAAGRPEGTPVHARLWRRHAAPNQIVLIIATSNALARITRSSLPPIDFQLLCSASRLLSLAHSSLEPERLFGLADLSTLFPPTPWGGEGSPDRRGRPTLVSSSRGPCVGRRGAFSFFRYKLIIDGHPKTNRTPVIPGMTRCGKCILVALNPRSDGLQRNIPSAIKVWQRAQPYPFPSTFRCGRVESTSHIPKLADMHYLRFSKLVSSWQRGGVIEWVRTHGAHCTGWCRL